MGKGVPGNRMMIVVAALALLALAAALLWRRGPGAAPPAAAAASDAGIPKPLPPRGAVAIAPLPPAGTPLREVFGELRNRAAAGEAGAACRLAAELESCEGTRQRVAAYDEQMWRLERATLTATTPQDRARLIQWEKMLEALGRGVLQRAERCEGVPSLSSAQRVALWRQAALAGQPAALTHYAVGNAFRHRELLEVLPELERYRREAEPLALRAAAQGDLQATLALAAAYSPRREAGERYFLGQVVAVDAARALALYRRVRPQVSSPLRGTVEDHIAWLQRQATPAQLAEADTLGAQWARDWQAPAAAAAAPKPGANGAVADIEPGQCGR